MTVYKFTSHATLQIANKWDNNQQRDLDQRLNEAKKTTVPVCRECNLTMTRIRSEFVVVVYSLLRREWFVGTCYDDLPKKLHCIWSQTKNEISDRLLSQTNLSHMLC